MTQTKNMNSATNETMVIKTSDDFRNFANRVNNGEYYLNANLENDIDMNPGKDVKAALESVDDEHVPSPSIRVPYCGVFNGKGHTFSGVYANCLFEKNMGIIQNLTVDGYVFNHNAAFIQENYGCIKNCVNKATVSPEEGAVAGIVYRNYPKGEITRCRNEGILNINRITFVNDIFCYPFKDPSQICHHSISIDKVESYEICRRYVAKKTHKELGELRIANNNSYIGIYLKTLRLNEPYGHVLDNVGLSDIIDLLAYYEEQGETEEHINGDGENYLHMLLKCEIPDELVPHLTGIISYIGCNYADVDFERKDKYGNSPEDLAKLKVANGHPAFTEVVDEIRYYAKQKYNNPYPFES